MRWLGHLVRMPPGRLPGEVFRARPTGRRPRGRPRTRWRDYVSGLAWERLGAPPEELEEVAGDRDVWVSLLKLLPPRPPEKQQIMDGWTLRLISRRLLFFSPLLLLLSGFFPVDLASSIWHVFAPDALPIVFSPSTSHIFKLKRFLTLSVAVRGGRVVKNELSSEPLR